jgi:hypothetical protein
MDARVGRWIDHRHTGKEAGRIREARKQGQISKAVGAAGMSRVTGYQHSEVVKRQKSLASRSGKWPTPLTRFKLRVAVRVGLRDLPKILMHRIDGLVTSLRSVIAADPNDDWTLVSVSRPA